MWRLGARGARHQAEHTPSLLFECLTGEPPFTPGTDVTTLFAHLQEEPPAASELKPVLPRAIDPVLQRALAKEPDDRYPTCARLIEDAREAAPVRVGYAPPRPQAASMTSTGTSDGIQPGSPEAIRQVQEFEERMAVAAETERLIAEDRANLAERSTPTYRLLHRQTVALERLSALAEQLVARNQ